MKTSFHKFLLGAPLRTTCLLFALGCLPAGSQAAEKRKAIFVSWDGAPDWVIDRLLEEKQLPHLARMAAEGARAEHSISTFPSKTAPAHATLWTGCLPNCHGLTSNTALPPDIERPSLLDGISAFSSKALTAEPLFLAAARSGLDVVVLSASHAELDKRVAEALDTEHSGSGRYRSFTGYNSRISDGRILDHAGFTKAKRRWRVRHSGSALEQVLNIADATFFLLAYDDPQDPVRGLDTVLVRQGHRARLRAVNEVRLKPLGAGHDLSGWSQPVPIRNADFKVANTFFRLFELAPDGSSMVLYQRQANELTGNHDAESLAALQQVYTGFHDEPFRLYGRGALGLPLMAGGSGVAEERVLELMAFDVDLVRRATRWIVQTWQPQLLVLYSPMSDGAGHAWVGQLGPESSPAKAELAAKLWPYYTRVFQLLDSWIGELVEVAGDDTAVVLTTDHGMAASERNFHVHSALARAGLLSWTPEGKIDLAKTKILTPAFGEFFLKVNSVDWRGGIVLPEHRTEVLEQAKEVLLAAKDPLTGLSPVRAVLLPDSHPELGLGGRTGGDLYLDLEPGYYPRSWPADSLVSGWRPPWGEGMHGFAPWNREMHGILFASGSGIRRGVELPPTSNTDVAPTLAVLLGIAPPRESTGKVISAMLESQGAASNATH